MDKMSSRYFNTTSVSLLLIFSLIGWTQAASRMWKLKDLPTPVELTIITVGNGFCLVEDTNGVRFEVPGNAFSIPDQKFLKVLAEQPAEPSQILKTGEMRALKKDFKIVKKDHIRGQFFIPEAGTETHFTGSSDVLEGSSIHFLEPDSWLVFPNLKPSQVHDLYLGSMLVNGSPAQLGINLRIVAYGMGTVVIPHGSQFPALTLHSQENLGGETQQIICYQADTEKAFTALGGQAGSLVLKRGYTATLAENPDGTGFSQNFVAQDHDVVIKSLPSALQEKLSFVRVFPWKWTGKKGIGGNFGETLGISWYYNWSINSESSLNLEYVPIKQKKNWPRLTQDWQSRGSVHLLGFNEPDKSDQANMTIDEAIEGWPKLLATGLRLGSPSTSDGGLKWLYAFMDRADKEGLRVDYIAVHYYRAVSDPGDGKAAAAQFKGFLQAIHNRTKRPLWVTEWNNGARWTKARDPKPQEQKRAVSRNDGNAGGNRFRRTLCPFQLGRTRPGTRGERWYPHPRRRSLS